MSNQINVFTPFKFSKGTIMVPHFNRSIMLFNNTYVGDAPDTNQTQ